MRTPARILLLSVVLLAAGSGALATNWEVEIVDFQFLPSPLTIAAGDSVTWHNNVITGHTVTSGSGCSADGLFNSGTLGLDDLFGFRFETSGSYPYFCIPHCLSDMRGVVEVETNPPATLINTWGKIRTLYR